MIKPKKISKFDSAGLIVKNVSWNLNEEALKAHFEKCGPVRRVSVRLHSETGKPSSYLVLFEKYTDANLALKTLEGTVLDDRRLVINKHVPGRRPTTQNEGEE
jgi:RNA recognition motif-containing protein